MQHILASGQTGCYREDGQQRDCAGTGEDGALRRGIAWPTPRFREEGESVVDQLTGLTWTRNAALETFPLTWEESFARVARLNQEQFGGFTDWRLPNRNELRSLISYQTRKPALPEGHPFTQVYLGWYWSSTTAVIHPAYAWSMHMEGARMFYGHKDQYHMLWPVRGLGNGHLPATGQRQSYTVHGALCSRPDQRQDGALRQGAPWPIPRFTRVRAGIRDQLTELIWQQHADLAGLCTWQQALDAVHAFNASAAAGGRHWHLPGINELASLVDCAHHSPALCAEHPFTGVTDAPGFWTATTSAFETDWAWVLYLDKGACGVGYKPDPTFLVWAVSEDDLL